MPQNPMHSTGSDAGSFAFKSAAGGVAAFSQAFSLSAAQDAQSAAQEAAVQSGFPTPAGQPMTELVTTRVSVNGETIWEGGAFRPIPEAGPSLTFAVEPVAPTAPDYLHTGEFNALTDPYTEGIAVGLGSAAAGAVLQNVGAAVKESAWGYMGETAVPVITSEATFEVGAAIGAAGVVMTIGGLGLIVLTMVALDPKPAY